jgi:hypothetical protein
MQLANAANLVRSDVNKVTSATVNETLAWIENHASVAGVVTPGARCALSSEILISIWSHFDMTGPFDLDPVFCGPLMPSVFRGMDGINILCSDRNDGLFAFVSIDWTKREHVLSHPLVREFAIIK